jgi:hypothetical protein
MLHIEHISFPCPSYPNNIRNSVEGCLSKILCWKEEGYRNNVVTGVWTFCIINQNVSSLCYCTYLGMSTVLLFLLPLLV